MTNAVAKLFGHEKVALLNVPSDEYVLPDCVVGIEIEVEGEISADTGVFRLAGNADRSGAGVAFLNKRHATYWNLVRDGSLRGGIELVTPQIFGKDITLAIQSLEEIHKSLTRRPPVFSYRCSTHVHLDARDLDKDHLLNLVLIYMMYEKYLFDFWGQNRYKNIYCIPINNCYSLVHPLMSLQKDISEDQIISVMNGFTENHRYAAFNLASLIKYGSVEFRHGHGTFDGAKIIDWINILMCLKRYAMSTSPKELLSLITAKPFEDLSHEVFGGMYNVILGGQDVVSLKRELYKSKRRLKMLLSCGGSERREEEHKYQTNKIFEQFLQKAPDQMRKMLAHNVELMKEMNGLKKKNPKRPLSERERLLNTYYNTSNIAQTFWNPANDQSAPVDVIDWEPQIETDENGDPL